MTPREIQAALARPFAPEDLEWRLQNTNEERMSGLAVPYVTNRAIQNRLDEVMGPDSWRNEYVPWHSTGKKESQICGISLYFEGRGWVTKWDGAENSDIEPIKGGLSDSMKRAAVHWGIGRVLYNMDSVWVDIEKRGKGFIIKDGARPKMNKAYLAMLEKLKIAAAAPTGTQAQLTPTEPQQSAPSKEADAPPLKGKTVPMPLPEPSYEYTVTAVKIQPGMNGESTSLKLEDREGKSIPAFGRGALKDLVVGIRLTNVKLTLHKQDTVAFYVLEQYEIAPAMPQAA